MPGYEIKEITAQETYDLRHRVLWPDHPKAFVMIPTDNEAVHLGAFVGAQIVGVVSLYDTPEGTQLRKLATDHAFRGKGIGSALVQHAIETLRAKGTARVFLSGRKSAHPFYRRLGFQAYGKDYLVESEPCQKMDLFLTARDG